LTYGNLLLFSRYPLKHTILIQLQVQNKLKPAAGRLLLAEPFMPDEPFVRSVVYICQHDEIGTVGFVLNKKNDWKLDHLLDDFPLSETAVYEGGPVCPEQLYYLHTKGDQFSACEMLEEGLFMGGSYQELLQSIESSLISMQDIRFFVGYSGWSVGQLEEEIEDKAWLVIEKKDIQEVMNCRDENDWKRLMERQGSVHKKMTDFPKDPRLN
jgi:putative transcriptional regulator